MRRFEEPSAGCLIPTMLGGGVLVFGAVLAVGLSEKQPAGGMRLFTPIYGVASYWMLTLCNRRTVVVDASGVRVSYGPFPNRSGLFIPRAQIAFCYVRDTVASFDEGTVPDGTYFAIGVETLAGQRIRFYSRDADAATALAAAGEISRIFNASPVDPPINARLVPAGFDDTTFQREFVFWGILALGAVFLGYTWEYLL